jgi:phosphoglycerate-specific signal transduction histidine kinase
MSTTSSPTFRIYFALQQAILLSKAQTQPAQIFSRISMPTELFCTGSFSLFVQVLTQLIFKGLQAYGLTNTNKLVFVTADYQLPYLRIKITDGGSALRYQVSGKLLRDTTLPIGHYRSFTTLTAVIKHKFNGELTARSFGSKGTQVTIELPVPSDTQNHDKS